MIKDQTAQQQFCMIFTDEIQLPLSTLCVLCMLRVAKVE